MVYRRQIGDEIVAFGHQGSVWSNAMVIYDHLTGSVWSQPYGTPIMGELEDMELEFIPSTMTTWGEWRRTHPDTLAYSSEYRYITRYEADGSVLERSTIVVKYFGEVVSYPPAALRVEGTIRDTVGGLSIVVALSEPESGTLWNVFSTRLADGTELDLISDPALPTAVLDRQSGTRWEVGHGRGIDGPLSNRPLVILPASMIFADKFPQYYPNGRTHGES